LHARRCLIIDRDTKYSQRFRRRRVPPSLWAGADVNRKRIWAAVRAWHVNGIHKPQDAVALTNMPSTDTAPALFDSGFVDSGGLRLHFLDYGTRGRPPMLCLHGRGAHAHWFDFVARDLAADYHVLALDLPGHGDSPWADAPAYTHEQYARTLADAVEHLGLRDFILVGHSMGGMISLLFAATGPSRLGKLVVIDSTLRVTEEAASQSRDIASRGRSYATKEEFMGRFRLRPEESAASPEVLRHIASHSARQQPDGTWIAKFDRRVYSSRKAIDGVALFAGVTVPTLLVKGALSKRITPQLVTEVESRCPQVQVAEVSTSYHHVTLDNPLGCVSELRKFLRSSSSSATLSTR